MQPSHTHIATLTLELARTVQQVLAWMPSVLASHATSGQLRDYCRRLRHQLAVVRRHHKPAWVAFARIAGRDGFSLWNGDRLESAHQAVATIAHRLYQLLGGRGVSRSDNGALAPTPLLRLELHLRRFVETLLPGFDVTKPSMPLGLFQALSWEHRSVQDAPSLAAPETSPQPQQAGLIVPNTEWEKLGPGPQELYLGLHRLQKPVASAKEILGHKPTKAEEWHLQRLVKLGFFRKPGGQSGRDRRGYCLGRVPTGLPDQRQTDVGRVRDNPASWQDQLGLTGT